MRKVKEYQPYLFADAFRRAAGDEHVRGHIDAVPDIDYHHAIALC